MIVPQREGAVGGADLHVLDLAVAQRHAGSAIPVILAPRASGDYRERLGEAQLETFAPSLLRVDHYHGLPARRGITLVHAHGYEANYLVAAMRIASRRWSQLAFVVTAHGWIETSPRLRLQSQLDRYCGRSAHVRIASAARHGRRLDGDRGMTMVIHNGVPMPDSRRLEAIRADRGTARTSLGVPMNATVVGTVGRLSPEKRIDLLLAAASRLLPTHPDIHLLIVGGGEQRPHLEASAKLAGLQGRVTFTGLLRDVTLALVAIDVLAQPSDTEGTPRSVIEAMAHQVPVVATDVGDIAEVVDRGRCGELVPPGDDHLLARAIAQLLDDPRHASRLAVRARSRYQQRYTIKAMCERVGESYEIAARTCVADRRR
ncbi:MAG: glycosyltransferase [Pseudonocardiaceae bacterium]